MSEQKFKVMFGDSEQEPLTWSGRKPYWVIKHKLFSNINKEIDANKFNNFIFIKGFPVLRILGFIPLYRCPEGEALIKQFKNFILKNEN